MRDAFHRRRARGGDPEVPVSSFSDIAFLLIIFFILVTSLAQLTGLQTELPAAEQSASPPEKTPVVLLHSDRMLFNEEELDIGALRMALADLDLAAQTGEGKVVLLEASGRVNYQQYYQAMAAISAAGGVVGIVQEYGP